MRTKRQNWIVTIHNSAGDASEVRRVSGTEKQVRTYLTGLVKADRRADRESWDFGDTRPEDVAMGPVYFLNAGDLYAVGCYTDYHIDYTAVVEPAITAL